MASYFYFGADKGENNDTRQRHHQKQWFHQNQINGPILKWAASRSPKSIHLFFQLNLSEVSSYSGEVIIPVQSYHYHHLVMEFTNGVLLLKFRVLKIGAENLFHKRQSNAQIGTAFEAIKNESFYMHVYLLPAHTRFYTNPKRAEANMRKE